VFRQPTDHYSINEFTDQTNRQNGFVSTQYHTRLEIVLSEKTDSSLAMILSENGNRQVISAIICMAISVLAVGLRFWCKINLNAGVHADDWWILASLLIYLGTEAAAVWGIY
jgi:hypothetical protein